MNHISVPAIEVNVVEHCNLACANCDHSAAFMPRYEVAPKDCARVLTTLSSALHAHELRIIGGEPLLHPRLAGVARACRSSGVADFLVLWTNGLLLDKIYHSQSF